MTVVSYRIYCDECENDEVIREDKMEDHSWKVNSKISHSGLCPSCNDAISNIDRGDSHISENVQFEKLDAIGETGAANLRSRGIVTRQDVEKASDEELLNTPWIGEKGLKSLRRHV